MRNFWKNKNVVVTGGRGFLGRHLVKKLEDLSPKNITIPSRSKFDLRIYEKCIKAFKNADIVIHLAANVGGIGYNKVHPADLFDDNILIGVNSLRAAKKCGVKKFVAIGTICEYPKLTPVPFKEKDLWNGYPEETNAPYGLAKKMLLVQSQAYFEQYKFKSTNLLPVNMYGPGDNFDEESSHVIPALIKKFMHAKYKNKKTVEAWGTGKATREFVYVDDVVDAIITATETVESPNPINIGSGEEISIRQLVKLIKKHVGYSGRVIWDTNMPDGQPRRKLDTTLAYQTFGFKSKIKFNEGLKNTIDWYLPIWKKENAITF